MAYFKSPEEMFNQRAENGKKEGDKHWAMAKNGEGGYHYKKAKECYQYAEENRKRAEKAKGKTWKKN